MMCAAAGMAHSGLVPFASTFALFGAGRAYEQIRNSIAYVGANVKLGLSHSGLSRGRRRRQSPERGGHRPHARLAGA